MRSKQESFEREGLASLDSSDVEVLSPIDRAHAAQGTRCRKTKLARALASIEGVDVPSGSDDPQTLAHYIESTYANDGPTGARLGAIYRKYSEVRAKLAMANMKLVAHVAKRFRDRGIPYSDLLQDGFCGLLEAIDRFDLIHQTKLATYATWWIRQSMQQAVASGAYPVRLTPRHLRQLAQNQEELERQELARRRRGSAGVHRGFRQRDDHPDSHGNTAHDLTRRSPRARLQLHSASDHE